MRSGEQCCSHSSLFGLGALSGRLCTLSSLPEMTPWGVQAAVCAPTAIPEQMVVLRMGDLLAGGREHAGTVQESENLYHTCIDFVE